MKGYPCDPNNIPQDGWIAEEKIDGFRVLMEFGSTANKITTRTGKDISNHLPHLRDLILPSDYIGTIIDGELTSANNIFSELAGIAGPNTKVEKAIAFQEENGWAVFNAFDILNWKGLDVQNDKLIRRKVFLADVIVESDAEYGHSILKYVRYYLGSEVNFKELLEKFWLEGKEGLMVKRMDAPYQQKKTKDVLKLKAIKTYDVIITGYQEPTKYFEGTTDLDKWPYWEDEYGNIINLLAVTQQYSKMYSLIKPVTKPYALGWVGAVEFGVYKKVGNYDGIVGHDVMQLVKVGECRGFTDADLIYIKENQKELIGKVMEVKAQGIIDETTGSLRHPRFNRWRYDKPASECTFENHIIGG